MKEIGDRHPAKTGHTVPVDRRTLVRTAPRTGSESEPAAGFVDPRRRGQIGLELASLALAGVVRGRARVGEIVCAVRGRYDFLASLPLRFLARGDARRIRANFALPLAYWGDRWNRSVCARSELTYALRLIADHVRKLAHRRLDSLKLAEYVAIPNQCATERMNRAMEQAPGVALVVEDPERALAQKRAGRDVLMEVHPGLGMSAGELEEFARANAVPLAYDTWHIRQEPELHQVPGGDAQRATPGDWECEIDRLIAVTGLVHSQPSRRRGQRNELAETLQGKRTELAAMTEALADLGYAGPVVVEHMFPLADQLFDAERVAARANGIGAAGRSCSSSSSGCSATGRRWSACCRSSSLVSGCFAAGSTWSATG